VVRAGFALLEHIPTQEYVQFGYEFLGTREKLLNEVEGWQQRQ
jgi:hypothetical protein